MIRTPLSIIKYTSIIITLMILANSCGSKTSEHGTHHQGINETLGEKSIDTIDYRTSSEELLAELQKVMVDLPESELQFYVPERTGLIQSFPCNNCHTQSLAELRKNSRQAIQKAHWEINLSHGSDDVMDCNTCHNESDFNQLKTITNKPLSFDHSYKLCGQCHSSQQKDWIGGAHGKRLGGWVPPRVVNTCTNCHDPHQPRFLTRWPARLNTFKLIQQGD